MRKNWKLQPPALSTVFICLTLLAGCGEDATDTEVPPDSVSENASSDVSSPASEGVVDGDQNGFPNRSEVDVEISRRVARQIADHFASTPFTIEREGKTYVITQLSTEHPSADLLVIRNEFCEGPQCEDRGSAAKGLTRIRLSELDLNAMKMRDEPGNQRGVSLACQAGRACIEYKLGDSQSTSMTWFLTCEDFLGCTAIMKNVSALVWRAVTPRNTARPSSSDKSPPSDIPHGIAKTDLPGKIADSLQALSQGSRGAEYLVTAVGTGNESLRLVRSDGAYVDQKDHLVVKRLVCLALISLQTRNTDACGTPSLLVDYDLHIVLSRLDVERVAIAQADYRNGESGFWVSASCAAGKAYCARLVVPQNERGTITTIMNSLGDEEERPNIRIPCANTTECDRVARALRQLAKNVNP